MKLVSWNCQGAFRKKADFILSLKPDILVVQECEFQNKLVFSPTTRQPNDILWIGDNQNKGLGVFSYCDYRFKIHDFYNPEFKVIVPVLVTNEQHSFTLFAIWANNPLDKDNRYIEQVWKAINYYDSFLNKEIIMIGDFNSNKIWDKLHRNGNHSEVVHRLFDKKIISVYHKHLGEEQGMEKTPTFFLQRNKNKPYHIDYCFASEDLFDKLINLEIGTYDNWIEYSDHSPLTFEFNM